MNDKIKHLLATAYKTDSIEKNKWRIENREQRREQRKKELKELMEKEKTMSNNKQSSVEWFWNQIPEILPFTVDTETAVKLCEAFEQAKAMHKEEIDQSYRDGYEFALINECATQSTSEASKYAEGYKEGYKRALELAKWTISNLTPPHNEQ